MAPKIGDFVQINGGKYTHNYATYLSKGGVLSAVVKLLDGTVVTVRTTNIIVIDRATIASKVQGLQNGPPNRNGLKKKGDRPKGLDEVIKRLGSMRDEIDDLINGLKEVGIN